jgi:hypothetical protein
MSADIDIDVPDRSKLLSIIDHISASQLNQGRVVSHNSGIYVTEIPYDPVNKRSAIDYNEAEDRGYFKIDILNTSVYQLVKDQKHYDEMLAKTPDWNRLWDDPKWASGIVHIGGHTDLLQIMRPDSIPRMAAFISVIRPGKAHLQKMPWDVVFKSVWDGDDSRGFVFKHSHSISYAMLVALHMNLVSE